MLLDLTHLEPEHIDAKLPDITEFARTYLGVEPYTEPVPVFPTLSLRDGRHPHHRRRRGPAGQRHRVPGLYAAGEVACVSVHGSNRLGTNSLLDINVFGKRAGIQAAEYAEHADFVEVPENPEDFVADQLGMLRHAKGHRTGGHTARRAAGDHGRQHAGLPLQDDHR